jgi:ADP-heptose:LPS heptosyltransferase
MRSFTRKSVLNPRRSSISQDNITAPEVCLPIAVNQQRQIQLGLRKRIGGSMLGCLATTVAAGRRIQMRNKPVLKTTAVLILEPYGMGDLISLEPLVRQLHLHSLEIRMSAKAAWRPLYPASVVTQWLDAVIPWSSYDSRSKYRWSDYVHPTFRSFLIELRELATGAIGIDPRGDTRSVLLLHLAGCRQVLSLDSYLGAGMRVPASSATLVPFRENARRWELNMQFLQLLGISSPSTPSPPSFRHFSHSTAVARRIGVVPVAPWTGKLWSREKWGQLVRALQSEGWQVCGLCGPNQTGAAADELDGGTGVHECVGLSGWVDQLAAVACLVTVDSGPMHLADALGIPVVALFGQGKLPLWAPSGHRSRVVSHQLDPDFVPCHPIEANAHLGKKFMNRIAVQEVLRAIHDVIQPPDHT